MNDLIRKELKSFIKEQGDKTLKENVELSEKIQRLDTLINLTKIVEHYDELQPILRDYFNGKADKEKWER
jgi:hypothetical protein